MNTLTTRLLWLMFCCLSFTPGYEQQVSVVDNTIYIKSDEDDIIRKYPC